MGKKLFNILKEYELRYNFLTTKIEYPEISIDKRLSKRILKELNSIRNLHELYLEYKDLILEKELYENEGHSMPYIDEKISFIENKTKKILLASNQDSFDGAIIEINNIELYNMYLNLIKKEEYNFSIDNNKIIVIGANIYSKFKNETGIHIIQNKKTESYKVIVIPYEKNENEIFSEKDLEVTYFHSQGAGGQNINKVETAVRIKHIKTNIVVECQDERSQKQNKEKALETIKERVKKYYDELNAKKIAKYKKELDLKNKIRLYDIEKDVVFDFKLNKEYNLKDVLYKDGLDDILEERNI